MLDAVAFDVFASEPSLVFSRKFSPALKFSASGVLLDIFKSFEFYAVALDDVVAVPASVAFRVGEAAIFYACVSASIFKFSRDVVEREPP